MRKKETKELFCICVSVHTCNRATVNSHLRIPEKVHEGKELFATERFSNEEMRMAGSPMFSYCTRSQLHD